MGKKAESMCKPSSMNYLVDCFTNWGGGGGGGGVVIVSWDTVKYNQIMRVHTTCVSSSAIPICYLIILVLYHIVFVFYITLIFAVYAMKYIIHNFQQCGKVFVL